MTEERAKQIIRAYELGLESLSEYVKAIRYLAEKYPDLTMKEMMDWINSDDKLTHAKFSEDDGVII